MQRGRSYPARVVIVDPSPAPTGALQAAINIARAMAPEAETFLVLAASAQVEDVDLSAFGSVERVPMRQLRRGVRDVVLFAPDLLAAGLKLRRLLRDDDVLIVNDFYLLHGWLLRRMGFRGRILTWVRIDPLAFPRPLRRMWIGAIRASSDAVIAVSAFIADRLHREGIVPHILYDPISPSSAPRLRSGHDTGKIVQIANFTRGKGQDDAIAAFARIAPRFPGVRLTFHGGDLGLARNRDYRAELERQAVATGFGDRIRFRGFARDPQAVLADADVALVLSHRESFSLACLEASGCGLPVVATRCGGPEEIVKDGSTGLLCPVGDIAAIAAATERLLSDTPAAAAMGAAGATLVRQRFSAATFAAGLRALVFPTHPLHSSAPTMEAGS